MRIASERPHVFMVRVRYFLPVATKCRLVFDCQQKTKDRCGTFLSLCVGELPSV